MNGKWTIFFIVVSLIQILETCLVPDSLLFRLGVICGWLIVICFAFTLYLDGDDK